MLRSEQSYTLDDIKRMAQERSVLPQRQKALSEAVKSRSKRRSEVAEQIRVLKGEIDANASQEEKIKQSEPNWLTRVLAFCLPITVDGVKEHEVAVRKLTEEREKKNQQLLKLQDEFIQDTAEIQAEEKEIKETNGRKAKFESIRLITNPQASLAELVILLHAAVYLFEQKHPVGQSSFVRRCLVDIPDKVTKILDNPRDAIPEVKQQEGFPFNLDTAEFIDGSTSPVWKELVRKMLLRDDQVVTPTYESLENAVISKTANIYAVINKMTEDEARHKYFQLYGLVNDMRCSDKLQLQAGEKHCDVKFFNGLWDLLSKVDVVKGVDAWNKYKDLKLENTDEALLVKKEKQAFADACDELKRLNTRLQEVVDSMHRRGAGDSNFEDLVKHSRNVLDTFQEANNLNDFDRKFATNILQTTAELLLGNKDDVKSKASPEVYERYRTYMHLAKSGQPSGFKKAVGVMCMFWGALLVAGSIAAKVLTWGLSTPVSNVTLGCGVALCTTGLGLFKAGMRKGLSKSMYRIEELSRDAHQVRQQLQKWVKDPVTSKEVTRSIFHKFPPEQPEPSAPVAQDDELQPGGTSFSSTVS